MKQSKPNPTLRKYCSRDWDSFVALDLETGLAGMSQASPAKKKVFAARWPKFLKSTYKWSASGPTTNASALYVIEDGAGEYAGHLWLTEQVDFFTGTKTLFVTTVAIAAKFRGRGWGLYLMKKAEKEARARGLNSVGLGVDAGNIQACKLYAKLGFRTTRLAMVKSIRRDSRA